MNGSGVYIFRTGSTFDTVAASRVNLIGGATTANTSVFWVPVGATTLGAGGATFKGTVMSQSAITMGDGVTLLDGRLLTTAHVTTSANAISRPFP